MNKRTPRDRAVSRIADSKLDCAIYSGGGYGRADLTLVSASTMEQP